MQQDAVRDSTGESVSRPDRHSSLRLELLWLIVPLIASCWWCVTAGQSLGATFDEPTYLSEGLQRWRTGSYSGLMRLGTMPLPVDVQTLPLYIWELVRGAPWNPLADGPRLLPYARLGTLLFWSVLLVYAWLAGRRLGEAWGGRLAVLLLACEPVFLAHASLATTDIAVSACLLALLYHFASGRDRHWLFRIGIPALWFAAAVLSKASGLVFGPICLFAVEIERIVRLRGDRVSTGQPPTMRGVWTELAPLRRDGMKVLGCGLLLVFLYVGSDWRSEPSFVEAARQMPAGPARTAALATAENLRVFTNAGEGLVRQVRHNRKGHSVYLLGRTGPRAVWYYFPVLLTIKLTLSLLALPLLILLLRPRTLWNWALVAAGLLLLLSFTFRVQIGVRLVLPLIALGVVGIAGAAGRAFLTGGSLRSRRCLAAGAGAAVLWAAVASAGVWPHGLCYTNEAWGGTASGYLRASDSNYDWGQGLKELQLWQARHSGAPLDVWYFGTDPSIYRMPVRHLPLHALPVTGPETVMALSQGRYLAAGTTLVYGAPMNPAHARAAAYLRGRRPAARTTTFLIYDFTGEAGPRPLSAAAGGEGIRGD